MATMNMVQALNSAMDVMLERDPDVLIFGEDVGFFGGVFRVTEGLQQRHGAARLRHADRRGRHCRRRDRHGRLWSAAGRRDASSPTTSIRPSTSSSRQARAPALSFGRRMSTRR